MAKKSQNVEGQYVRKETFWLGVLLALAVGFFGGVMFAVIRSESPPVQGQMQSPPPRAAETDRSGNIVTLEQQTKSNPQNADAWIQLGNEYFDSNQYDKAIQAYSKSLELKPNNANVWTDMGIMYRRSGKPEEAIKAFDRAIESDPKHEISRMNKGIVLLHDMKDTEGAINAWEGLLEINPVAMAPTGRSVDEMIQQLKKQGQPGSGTAK
ncbi:MAG: tetratricopeptide repeat protein [Desulfobacterales bacterium]|jgi:cytochrome c-type biogenesis protein CcmH/NrfG